MISELGRYLLVSVAMVVFLAAAQNAAGFGWRGTQTIQVSSIR